MTDTLTQVPTTLVAGDSFAWERDLSDYPAGTWTLTYYFANEADHFNVVATADGTTHLVSAAGAATAAYKPGRYRWHARVTDGSTITTIEDGWTEIQPDPTKGAIDWRTHARKMIEAIEATLEGQASKQQLDLLSYSFGAVNVNRDRKQLIELRDKYARELQSEPGSNSVGDPRHVYLRFGPP